MDLKGLVVRKNENHKIQLSPFASNEVIEVVDEDKFQRLDTIPAELVSDSLVEVVKETGPRPHSDIHVQKDESRFKNLLENKPSLSTAISKLSENNVHTVQTRPYKNKIKTKQKVTKSHESRMKTFASSQMVPRVSIPGKHSALNTSQAKFSWMASLSPRQFASLKHNYLENMTRLTSNINAKDGINQKDRNVTSPPGVLDTFRVRMGLDAASNADQITPRQTVVGSRTHHLLPKTSSWHKENAHSSPKKVFIESVPNGATSIKVIKGEPKSIPASSKLPSVSKDVQRAGMPFKKKQTTIQLEPEVFDNVTDIKSNENEHLISKGPHNSNGSRLISPTPVSLTSVTVSKGANSVPSQKKVHTIQIEPEVLDSTFKVKNETEHFILNGRNKNNGKTSKFDKFGQFGHSNVKMASHNEHKSPVKIPQRQFSNSTIDQGQVTQNKEKYSNRSDSSIVGKIARTGHTNGGVPLAKNSNDSSNMDLSANSESGFNITLNSTIEKHLLDLISFFNSFYGSNNSYNGLKPKLHDNRTKTNNVKNSTGNKSENSILENLKNFLAFIRVKTPDDNYTRKALVTANMHTLSNDSISDRSVKILQMIYRGWNKGSKRKGFRLKTANPHNSSVKNASSLSTDTMTGSRFNKSREDEFENHLLELMRKASRKELENLKNHILKVLGSSRLRNFAQQHHQRNQQQQLNQARLNKKHKTHEQSLNRSTNSTKYYGKENLRQQQPKNHNVKKEVFLFGGRKPKQHPDLGIEIQNYSKRRNNHTHHEQVENGTTLCQYKQPQVSEALQEQSLNISQSMNSTTGQNCSSDSLETGTTINYDSHKTKPRLSHALLANRITNFFHNYLSTSRVNTSTLKGIRINTKAKTSLSHSPVSNRITNFFHNHLSTSHGNTSTLTGITTKAKTSLSHSPISNRITNFFHNHLSTSHGNTSTLTGITTRAKTSLSHSPISNRITNFFHNHLSTSHGNTSTLKGITTKAKTSLSHSPVSNRITNFFHNHLSTSHGNTSTLKGITTKAKTSLSHSSISNRITNFFHNHLSTSYGNTGTLKGITTKAKTNLYLNFSPNTSAIYMPSDLAPHGLSPKKKGRNTTALHRAQSSSVVQNTRLDAADYGDDIKSKSVQHYEDVFQETEDVKPSLVVHKLGPKAMEVTEYFEQGKQKLLKTD